MRVITTYAVVKKSTYVTTLFISLSERAYVVGGRLCTSRQWQDEQDRLEVGQDRLQEK